MSSKYQDDLTHIRAMMEKSSTFISLSGLSGVIAGITALVGAVLANNALKNYGINHFHNDSRVFPQELITELISIALGVLIFSITAGIYLTIQKSKNNRLSIWNKITKQVLIHLMVPLIAGGIFCLILLHHHIHGLIAPVMLIFYGLALVNASKFTYGDIRWLGYLEILLGLISSYFIGYGLIFWAIGFGVLHIVYGIVMYNKYDRK